MDNPKYPRIEISYEIQSLYLDDEPLKDIIELLSGILEKNPEAYTSQRSYDYSDGEYIAIMGKRMENDSEYASRIEKTIKLEAQNRERDLRTLAALTAKYGTEQGE